MMLSSYSWDFQASVQRINESLITRGLILCDLV